jgi:tRNA A-37 threonylcarbamoyl transferase component Bud32
MDTKRLCPSCQKPLAPNVPMGLCPECLIKAGFPTGVETDTGSAKQPAFVPPTVEEIAKLFPQLEILELVGKGGMGAVYKARQKQLNRFVALKILPPGIGSEPAFAERFTREAQALARLNHPSIVTLYEFGETSGQFYFLTEFVDGVNLRQLLAGSRISAREALAIVPQICDALQFAHDQGIVHRDIKPENILLDRRGRVKVADFGLAKLVGAGNEPMADGGIPTSLLELTESGKIMGTPNYMAPEQVEHPGEVDNRADIYALGVVFYQMLTGELPGKKIEPPSSKVQIDVRLDEIVLRALEKKPELRYQQVSEVKTCVETITSSIGREARTEKSETQSSISRTALAGAIWSGIGLLVFITACVFELKSSLAARLTIIFVLTVPFGTTILGWIAVSQIRRSAGKLHGMWLAVFDGLLFPLLAVDAVIAGFWIFILKVAFMDHLMIPVCALLTLVTIGGIDCLIIRAVWRTVNKTVAPPVQKPDRFRRWFAMAVFAMIAIPILISLTAIAIPNFVTGRNTAMAIQSSMTMSETVFLQKFDSNLISHATINYPSLSGGPISITGTFYQTDSDGSVLKPNGKPVEADFIAPNVVLTPAIEDKLLSSDKVELRSPNPMRWEIAYQLLFFAGIGVVFLLIPGTIIYVIWRMVKKPIAAHAPPIQKPDRFWRWFAVSVFAMIAIPFLISIVGLLAAIVIPNFVKARSIAIANRQKSEMEAAKYNNFMRIIDDETSTRFAQADMAYKSVATEWADNYANGKRTFSGLTEHGTPITGQFQISKQDDNDWLIQGEAQLAHFNFTVYVPGGGPGSQAAGSSSDFLHWPDQFSAR